MMVYISKTIGYNYEDVMAVSEIIVLEVLDFLKKVIVDESTRDWLLCRYARTLQSIVENLFIVHANVTGANGKTTLAKLMLKTFGKFGAKADNKLIYENNSVMGSANEVLNALRNILYVALCEPNESKKICASAVKELTGGDGISCRGIYKSQGEFDFNGLINLSCNHIPCMNTNGKYDGGSYRRMKVIMYLSTFTSNEEKVDERKHTYLLDCNIKDNFDVWKYAMMKILLSYADKNIIEPAIIKENSMKYMKKQSLLSMFLDEYTEKLEDKTDGYISGKDLFDVFKLFCEDEVIDKKPPFTKSNFIELATDERFTKDCFISNDKKTINGKEIKLSSSWVGWKIKDEHLIKGMERDDLDGKQKKKK